MDYDTYIINLTLDYALTALTLSDPSTVSANFMDPHTSADDELLLSPNPAGSRVQISRDGRKSGAEERLTIYSARGARIRSLVLDASGRTDWNLCDEGGHPVAAGVYFVRTNPGFRPSGLQRFVIVR